jgi:hypothetical protein
LSSVKGGSEGSIRKNSILRLPEIIFRQSFLVQPFPKKKKIRSRYDFAHLNLFIPANTTTQGYLDPVERFSE